MVYAAIFILSGISFIAIASGYWLKLITKRPKKNFLEEEFGFETEDIRLRRK